jgi:hypothetical protein
MLERRVTQQNSRNSCSLMHIIYAFDATVRAVYSCLCIASKGII